MVRIKIDSVIYNESLSYIAVSFFTVSGLEKNPHVTAGSKRVCSLASVRRAQRLQLQMMEKDHG